MRRLPVLLALVLGVILGLVQPAAQAAVPGPQAAASPGPLATASPVPLAEFDIRDYGAVGDGATDDSDDIQQAVDAAAAAGGGTVVCPTGQFKSKRTVHLKSNVFIRLDSGCTILGSSADTYDPPEPNPWDDYQDYGHSHFHNAMFYGDGLSNIGFFGTGRIDGAGNLITGNPASGEADKIISLTRCRNLTMSGITLREGGHFAALINGCDTVVSDRLILDTAMDRDGWNIISTTNVTITNAHFDANDDALAFKSDYALGAKLPNGHVTVTDSYLSAGCCNALMFGSETCGDFTDYTFERITIEGSDKSGLGMVSMDGAKISDVHYKDITMTDVHSPIMIKIGNRKRCGNNPGVGTVSNVTYTNIKATGSSPSFSPTLWGEAGSSRISDIVFDNVDITVPGGSAAVSTAVPTNASTTYNPNSIGTRPAYGWYIRRADNVRFTDSEVRFASNDNRPAVIANESTGIRFDRFTAQRGSGSSTDLLLQTVTGYCVANSANTSGGALRTTTSGGSTQNCGPLPARYEAESAAFSAGSTVDSNHAGYSGTGFVNTANEVGAYVQWTAQAAAAGTANVTLGYANGTTADRPMDITVNGTVVATGVSFPVTGAWTTWRTVTVPVPLTAGANTIRATAAGAGGCPNLDYLDGPAL